MVAVLSPIFTKTMFGMANTRSATIGVLFLQFSPPAGRTSRGSGDDLATHVFLLVIAAKAKGKVA